MFACGPGGPPLLPFGPGGLPPLGFEGAGAPGRKGVGVKLMVRGRSGGATAATGVGGDKVLSHWEGRERGGAVAAHDRQLAQ